MAEPHAAGDLPQDVEDAVLEALELPDAERDARLGQLLRQHAAHGPAIRRWLAASGVEVPAVPATEHTIVSTGGTPVGGATGTGDEALPRRLGPYVLQRLLGRGGFGTVYRALQLEPIHREVAVKVLNPGMDSRDVLARFTAEREALNRMDHVGIARLLDAGTTPQGRPFFVMELVEGPTLSSFCRQRELSIRRRIELFLLVCDAMQHAHQKAVLHRDLSSNNVLVADPDGRAQPKIIDFGIAKSLSDPLLQGGAMTFQGTLMGTPEFMSPEQAAGRTDDVDTRADVYALGVQLYELLTDHLPIPGVVLRAQGIAGIARVVASHVPVPPSAAAARERRAALRGDLDAIVMKAIEKSRDDRYASVAELAADLRRHLGDRPVHVAEPTIFYRLRKFVRRNRVQSFAIVAIALGVVVGLSIAVLALHQASLAAESEARMSKEMQAKANAGFRLLVNEPELQRALAAEAALPPPFPEHAHAYAAWLDDVARLADAAAAVQQRRQQLAALRVRDAADDYLSWALDRLAARFAELLGPDGARARVLERRRFCAEVIAPADAASAARWKEVADRIRARGGTDAEASPGRSYGGAELLPMPGLVPLGPDPRTTLFEFLDVCSHEEGAPLPVRDEHGRLQVDGRTGVVFVLLPPGIFSMGARRDRPGYAQHDPDATDDELHGGVLWLEEFLIARTELTEAQWRRLERLGVRVPSTSELPVTGVDWTTGRRVLAGAGMVHATEAQWEYACRADTRTPWSWGASPEQPTPTAWFGAQTQQVGRLAPNRFGLFDMHGNAAEWCRDEFLSYRDFPARAGTGLRASAGIPSPLRCVRGGACFDGPLAARASARRGLPVDARDLGVGLRPVRLVRAERHGVQSPSAR